MILADTSVVVQLIRGEQNPKVAFFEEVVASGAPFGISAYTVTEVLQGARSDEDYETLREYLLSQRVFYLPQEAATYVDAAEVFYRLRKRGIRPRGTIDVLIALTAALYNLELLHNDRDYDLMAPCVEGLRIYGAPGGG